MRGGIFYGETFGNRGGVEFSISRNQRHCFKPHRLTPPIPFKGNGKLDGIIGTKAVTVMLAYSSLVWQEWQQRQERARPGRPRGPFPPRADRRRRTLPEIHRQICDWLRHEAAKESVLRELMSVPERIPA